MSTARSISRMVSRQGIHVSNGIVRCGQAGPAFEDDRAADRHQHGGRQVFSQHACRVRRIRDEPAPRGGFVNAKAPGYEADDFLAAAAASEKKARRNRTSRERRSRQVKQRRKGRPGVARRLAENPDATQRFFAEHCAIAAGRKGLPTTRRTTMTPWGWQGRWRWHGGSNDRSKATLGCCTSDSKGKSIDRKGV
jgi:hypothetical protein